MNATRAALTSLRVYVEAAIDFPEEEIDFLASTELRERLEDVQQRMSSVLAAAEQGAVLTRGLTVAIAGRPNAGKSTLMNRLAGHDVAIVTPVAGTTRDLLRERIEVDGVPVELHRHRRSARCTPAMPSKPKACVARAKPSRARIMCCS